MKPSNALKKLMADKKWSLPKAAVETGVNRGTLNRVLADDGGLSIAKLTEIFEAWGYRVEVTVKRNPV